ncbi:TIGR01244 family sulfur transferase [Castellaniella sp.]|uniref:TIGR01244 family sulfur transferase n=1 Tax=Castellaniella sp. TaxID=1955812 RepID=UPI003C77622D
MSVSYQSLAPDFAVSGQLQPSDMAELAQAGFKSVIINRPDGEGGAEQPQSDAVLAAARAAGMEARYQPVVSGSVTQANVMDFAALLQELPGPVLAFCRSGGRCTKLFQSAQNLASDQSQG